LIPAAVVPLPQSVKRSPGFRALHLIVIERAKYITIFQTERLTSFLTKSTVSMSRQQSLHLGEALHHEAQRGAEEPVYTPSSNGLVQRLCVSHTGAYTPYLRHRFSFADHSASSVACNGAAFSLCKICFHMFIPKTWLNRDCGNVLLFLSIYLPRWTRNSALRMCPEGSSRLTLHLQHRSPPTVSRNLDLNIATSLFCRRRQSRHARHSIFDFNAVFILIAHPCV
jgi:hypothetical protein